jgi:hypothetical protein
MNPETRRISVIDPIGPAIERVKLMLFRPFIWGKWFAVGFCAWLAMLGEGGGPNFNFGSYGDGHGPAESLRQTCAAHIALIVFVAAMVVAVMICIWVVFLWLSSRGRFMFLNCVARNTDKIKAPWRNYATVSNSLFLFRVAAAALFLVALAPLIVVMVWCGILLSKGSMYANAFIITGMVFLGLLMFAAIVIFSIIMKFTYDFVVPVMYIHGLRCMEGWGRFRSILSRNKGKFVLYILFQIVIGLAIGVIVMAIVLGTCCCAACIFAIPYIGTVALLPLWVFKRSYSLYYLRQYGDEYNVFAEEQVNDSGVSLLPA